MIYLIHHHCQILVACRHSIINSFFFIYYLGNFQRNHYIRYEIVVFNRGIRNRIHMSIYIYHFVNIASCLTSSCILGMEMVGQDLMGSFHSDNGHIF
jgi:hypothetical protein